MAGPPSPKVLIHPDFLRLEAELVALIRSHRTGPDDAFSPLLVLAPSQRMVRRLRGLLTEELGPLMAVEVLHHQALAYLLTGNELGRSSPQVASRSVLNYLVGEILEGRTDLVPGQHLAEHPTSLAPIAGLVRELRETGIDPKDLRGTNGGIRVRDMGVLLSLYEEALAALETEAGWTDRAGLVRRAQEAARRHPPYAAVFAYGAYDLVGMNLDLLRSLPTASLTYLVPADPVAPAWRYAREFIARHLKVEPEALTDDPDERTFVRAARQLRVRDGARADAPTGGSADDKATGGGATGDEEEGGVEARFHLAHVQGPEAELNCAARRALAHLEAGVPMADLGIVARNLEPYVALAETVFARHGLPVDTSAALPLARHPLAVAFQLLLRALARDFERQTVVDLFRSPFLARPEGGAGWAPDRWDRWSRRYRLVEGAAGWTEELPAALKREQPRDWEQEDEDGVRRFEIRREANLASADTLGHCVSAWVAEGDAWEQCADGAAHAAFLRRLAARWIRGWGDGEGQGDETARKVVGALSGILDDLESLDELDRVREAAGTKPGGGAESLSVTDVLSFVEESVRDASVDWSRPGGLRFLDVMQARGLTFRHLTLIGFNADLMPRRPREDLFLPDRVRSAWRERTGRPMAVRMESREEEWLLFAQTVAAATESLTVTWQRADAEGKTRSVSLFMRELARILPAGTDPPKRVPTHPGRAAAHFAGETGLLTLEEAALLTCETAPERSDSLSAFLNDYDPALAGRLTPGLDMVRAIDRFGETGAESGAGPLRFDGFLPRGSGWDRPFSSSSLDMLGACPQKFFFRYVLGLHPLEEAGEEFRFEARELGMVIHGLLENVFKDLHEAGLLQGGDDTEELVAAGRRALAERWEAALAPMARRVGPRFPVLFEQAERFWREEAEAFLEKDLRRLAGGGQSLVATEENWMETLDLSGGAALLDGVETVRESWGSTPAGASSVSVRGIPDRVTSAGENAWLVSDYKTSGKIEDRVGKLHYLRGKFVQIPVYIMLAEARGAERADAELLGLGPDFLPDRGYVRDDSVTLDTAAFTGLRPALEETMLLLTRLAREGRFPFRPGFHCGWCDYQSPCRRHHFPTKTRVTDSPAYLPYFMLQKKTVKKPNLADVPPPSDEDES